MSNAATVQEIYAAFGQGDMDTILGHIAEDCAWESWADNSAQAAGVPYLLERRGPQGCAAFLGALAHNEIKDFQVLDIIGDGRQIAAEVSIHYVTPAGRELRDEELLLWTFDEDGKVARLRHYVDTAKHIAALA
jgi:ketosteroid isomerase-like protein